MAKFSVRPDIDAAAERLSQTLGAKREITRLPEVLWEGETVDMLATGEYGGGVGLVAMTTHRLLFFKHGVMSQKVEDFPYSKISSVQWSAGMVQGALTVYASGNKAEIKRIPKADGKPLADKLRTVLAQGGGPAPVPQEAAVSVASQAPAVASASDVASRLSTLDELRAAGAITEAEYQERRSAILATL